MTQPPRKAKRVGAVVPNCPGFWGRTPASHSNAKPRAVGDNRPYLLTLLLAIASIASIASAASITLDIPVFAGGYGTAFYEESARLFEQQRPDVRIRLYGDPRIADKIRIRIMEGNLPDAMLPRDVLIPALARSGLLLPIDSLLDLPNWEGDARWGDTFRPGALDGWVVDDRRYGVPTTYACWSLFYNRDLFRKHGWTEPATWEGFFSLCDRIRSEAGIAPVALTGIYGAYPDAFLRAAYYNLAGAEGWRALQASAPGAHASEHYIRAATVLQRVTRDHTLDGWQGMTHTAAQLAFLEGRAAMTVSGSWMLAEMAGRIPEDMDIGVMNFPVFADGAGDPTVIQTGADNLFVFATGRPEHERAAIDFLRFLTSRERMTALVRQVDAPVAVRGVPREAYSPAMRDTIALIDRARDGFNMPQRMLQAPTVRQALIDQRLLLMNGAITPEEFGQRMEAAAATDRHRAAHPEEVQLRHPIAGTVFLAVLGLAFAWLLRVGAPVLRRPGFRGRSRDARVNAKPRAVGDNRPYLKPAPSSPSDFGRLRWRVALVFVGPALLLYVALVLLPGLTAFGWSFLRWDGLGERSWAGLYQFKHLLFEFDGFWPALGNNLFLMLVPTVAVVPLALLFATLFHRGIWGANVFRVVFLFPNLLGGIAATLLWLNAYEPHGGLVNAALVGAGELLGSDWLRSFDNFPWLAPHNLYPALVPVYLWMACGFNLILYLAAMEGIDSQLYEAAELDGAGPWRQFLLITLPMIREVLIISAVFIVIAGLNAFEMVWLLTSQDPDTATHTLGTLMVSSMFKDFDVGRATAIAILLFVLVFTASALLLRGSRREALE